MTDMEKETVTDEILEETEQESAEDMSQEQTDAQAAENQPDDKDVQTDDKKRFFGKKKDKKDEQIEDLTDRLRRQMAEFENFRKRTEKEKSQMYDMGAKTIVEKILPVIDNFERGLAAVPEDNKEDAFVVGMDKIYRQMLTVLEEAGVKPIEAVGAEFDPNFHNAVMHVEDETLGENSRRTPEGIYVQRYCGKTQYGKSSKLIIP